MCNWILPPKIINWKYTLPQSHISQRPNLLVSGSSFTAIGYNDNNQAASWPGYVYERCRLNLVIDQSYPAVGNRYISESIIDTINSLSPEDRKKYFVIVMWNSPNVIGIPDKKHKIQNTGTAIETYELIIKTSNLLFSFNIPYAFTLYANLLYPPFLPKRDYDINLKKFLTKSQIKDIEDKNLIPKNQKDFFYDFSFFNDMLDHDDLHPSINSRLKWTDNVLLKNLQNLKIVNPIGATG
jgi:hypothetical protein